MIRINATLPENSMRETGFWFQGKVRGGRMIVEREEKPEGEGERLRGKARYKLSMQLATELIKAEAWKQSAYKISRNVDGYYRGRILLFLLFH